jgi:hypothetical protein
MAPRCPQCRYNFFQVYQCTFLLPAHVPWPIPLSRGSIDCTPVTGAHGSSAIGSVLGFLAHLMNHNVRPLQQLDIRPSVAEEVGMGESPIISHQWITLVSMAWPAASVTWTQSWILTCKYRGTGGGKVCSEANCRLAACQTRGDWWASSPRVFSPKYAFAFNNTTPGPNQPPFSLLGLEWDFDPSTAVVGF